MALSVCLPALASQRITQERWNALCLGAVAHQRPVILYTRRLLTAYVAFMMLPESKPALAGFIDIRRLRIAEMIDPHCRRAWP
jgi:hypothetical protein